VIRGWKRGAPAWLLPLALLALAQAAECPARLEWTLRYVEDGHDEGLALAVAGVEAALLPDAGWAPLSPPAAPGASRAPTLGVKSRPRFATRDRSPPGR
jgi:hypothetical protein